MYLRKNSLAYVKSSHIFGKYDIRDIYTKITSPLSHIKAPIRHQMHIISFEHSWGSFRLIDIVWNTSGPKTSIAAFHPFQHELASEWYGRDLGYFCTFCIKTNSIIHAVIILPVIDINKYKLTYRDKIYKE